MRTTAEVTLPVRLDRDDLRPLPVQLADALRHLVLDGWVAPGDPLPSTRSLARAAAVSRGTVVAAYDQLRAEGFVTAREGAATVVNPHLAAIHPQPARTGPEPPPAPVAPVIDLRPGRPWTAGVATAGWRAAWRAAATDPFSTDPSPAGDAELRSALADHLRRMRGVHRPSGQVLVTAGAREGLALLLHALGRPGPIGVEEPGYPSLRRVPGRLGLATTPLPADADGLVTDALPEHAVPPVLVVTPSHQYPLGGSMPVLRRQQLLAWAARHDVVIVEDDYDAELRYTSRPLPALAALDDPDHGRVVTLGTFAKTVGPGLAVGYLLAPGRLLPDLLAARTDLGQPVAQLTQRALAHYLESGELRRHVQRVRQLYGRRRQLVATALAGLRHGQVYPMDGGLHVVIETERNEAEVLAVARAGGVLAGRLSAHWSGERDDRSGVVFGFGGVAEPDLSRALTVLVAAIDR
ncbi:PLP-dependent aminotransferase family protein [Micropruina sp.]|uniref:MocR-like pyridoxine biosynthesis transcription factor PdxR n=1 Tax=Micropruina sp. TaxID=2737536 RepID=UPI0039E25B0B